MTVLFYKKMRPTPSPRHKHDVWVTVGRGCVSKKNVLRSHEGRSIHLIYLGVNRALTSK